MYARGRSGGCRKPAGAIRFAFALVPALTLLACEPPKPEPTAELTRRQKDSVVARSGLPGARGVEKALNVLQATEDRAAALEQATR